MKPKICRGRTVVEPQCSSTRCDQEAEGAVLACLLLAPERFNSVAALLEPTDFTDQANRTIFHAMVRLRAAGKPIDITLLVGELSDAGHCNTDVPVATLFELFRLLPLVRHFDHYVARVVEVSRRAKGLCVRSV